MRNYSDKIKRYMPFNAPEIKALIITIICLTFIVAFNDKRADFSLFDWTSNFIFWLIIVTISVIVKQLGHRLIGIFYGFRVEYKLWWYGLIIGLLIAFVSRGNIWLLIPGGIMIHQLSVHRIGWFRYGTNMRAFSIIALFGPLANILFATLIKTLQIWLHIFPAESLVVDRIFLFNMAYAAYNLLPIPPLDGSRIIYDSRLIYIFTATSIAAYAFLAWLKIYSYIFALVIGIIAWLLFYLYVERK